MPDTPVSTIFSQRPACVAGGISGIELEDIEVRLNNAVDEGIEAVKASASEGAYAATEEGGYRKHGQVSLAATGGGNATVVTVDSSIDWRERRVMARIQGYDAAAKLPGGASEDQNAPTNALTEAMFFTSGGSTQAGATPPGTPRREFWAADVHLFVDSADGGKLKLCNTSVATAYYVEFWLEATGKLY